MNRKVFQCRCGYIMSRLTMGETRFEVEMCEECGANMNEVDEPEEKERILKLIFPKK